MVRSGNHQLGFGYLGSNQIECLDHEFETFIGSPFAESENAVDGSSTSREIGELGPACKNAMGAQVDVVPAVFVVQDLTIAGHKHGDGIREQQHSRSYRAREAI